MTTSATTRSAELNDKVVTSWLPLSTAWPSYAGCATSLFYVPVGQSGTLYAWDPRMTVVSARPYSCQPPQIATWRDPNLYYPDIAKGGGTSLSLGPLVCPQAYGTSSSSVKGSGSTFVFCCPKSYDFKGPEKTPMSAQCQSILGAGNTITYAAAGKGGGLSTWSLQVDSTIYGMPINGWAFEAQATATGTAAPAAPPTTSSSSPADSPSSSPDLGPIIGGVVGGVALIVLVVIAAVWGRPWWRKWREGRAHLKEFANGEGDKPGQKPGWRAEQVPLVPVPPGANRTSPA